MSALSPTDGLASQIAAAVAEIRARSGAGVQQAAQAGTARKQGPTKHSDTARVFNQGQYLAGRLKTIDPDDAQRRSRAFRYFLESTLLSELGSDLLNDPAFYQLVDQVQAAMQANPTLADAIAAAGEYLLDNVSPAKPR